MTSGHSWARSLGFFSKSKKKETKSTDETEPINSWGPEQEKKALMHGKDTEYKLFKDEPIPDHFMGYDLPDPVRNTEREYFQTHQNPNWEGHQRGVFDSRFYSKKYGISKEVYAWLHWDLNFNDNDEIDFWRTKLRYRMLKEDQRSVFVPPVMWVLCVKLPSFILTAAHCKLFHVSCFTRYHCYHLSGLLFNLLWDFAYMSR